MSNIFALNGATPRQQGTGLLVYSNKDHIFSNASNGFNSTQGLWRVPANRTPTFQIELEYNTLLSFRYLETRGCNNFTGVVFPVPVGGVSLVWSGLVNGLQRYRFQTSDNFIMATPAPSGRWVGEIIVQDGAQQIIYYTEEFITTGCCYG